MHTVVALVALLVLITVGALRMAAKNVSDFHDFAAITIITLLIALYFSF